MLLSAGNVTAHAGSASLKPIEVQIGNPFVLIPDWLNTHLISIEMSFNNGRGALSSTVIGQPGTTNIEVTAVLERLNANGTYSHVNTWHGLTASGNVWLWSTDYFVARGHTYRLTINATVHRNGIAEHISVCSSRFAN